MPRYFFNVRDSRATVDEVGEELADVNTVRKMAVQLAGQILALEADEFWSGETWGMSVTDERGAVVLTLEFTATIHDAV